MEPLKTKECHRAVITIDATDDIVGRNGKSLFCYVIAEMLNTVFVDGKGKFEQDRFIWSDVSNKTKLIVIDDLRPNFNFCSLYDAISGDFVVNRRYQIFSQIIPYSSSPKILLSSKYRPLLTPSTQNRLWRLKFSDFYNENNLVEESFSTRFIHGWDDEQLSLMNQLVSDCMSIYQEFGFVQD